LTINPSIKNGLKEKSVALVFQVRAIDRRKLIRKIGSIEDATLESVNRLLTSFLMLDLEK
jgi:mRNA interferase MazF